MTLTTAQIQQVINAVKRVVDGPSTWPSMEYDRDIQAFNDLTPHSTVLALAELALDAADLRERLDFAQKRIAGLGTRLKETFTPADAGKAK